MLGLKNTNLRSLTVSSVAELAIIVVGVLLALAADDWRTSRQDRTEEAEILRAIAEDIRVSEELLRIHLNSQAAILDDLKALSEGSAGRAAQIDDTALAEMLNRGLWDTPTLSVQMSAYKEIQTSGRMRLIDDPTLRRALAEYDQEFLAASVRSDDSFQHQQTKLDPYVIAHFQMSQFSRFALADFENADQLEPLPNLRDHRALLDDEVLQNLIASKYYLLWSDHTSTGDLLQSLSELAVFSVARSNETEQ